jgi:hypothetical protein
MPALYGRASTACVVVVPRFRLFLAPNPTECTGERAASPTALWRAINSPGGSVCTAVYTAGSPKGKGTLYFYSNSLLAETRCRCNRAGYVPSLHFSYTTPVTLCYNHAKLAAILILLLDVVSRFAFYSGEGSLSYSKRKRISIHAFFLASAVPRWACMPNAQHRRGG